MDVAEPPLSDARFDQAKRTIAELSAAVAAGRDLEGQQLRMLAMDARALAAEASRLRAHRQRSGMGPSSQALAFVADQLQSAAQHLPDRIYLTAGEGEEMSDVWERHPDDDSLVGDQERARWLGRLRADLADRLLSARHDLFDAATIINVLTDRVAAALAYLPDDLQGEVEGIGREQIRDSLVEFKRRTLKLARRTRANPHDRNQVRVTLPEGYLEAFDDIEDLTSPEATMRIRAVLAGDISIGQADQQ